MKRCTIHSKPNGFEVMNFRQSKQVERSGGELGRSQGRSTGQGLTDVFPLPNRAHTSER